MRRLQLRLPVALVAARRRGPSPAAGPTAAASVPRQSPPIGSTSVRRIVVARANDVEHRAEPIALVEDPQDIGRSGGTLDLDVVPELGVARRSGRVAQQHPGDLGVGLDRHPDRGQLDAVLRRPQPIAHRHAAARARPAPARPGVGAGTVPPSDSGRSASIGHGPSSVVQCSPSLQGRDGSIGGVAEVGAPAEGGLEPIECVGDRVHLECSPPGPHSDDSFGRSTEILPEVAPVVKRLPEQGTCAR